MKALTADEWTIDSYWPFASLGIGFEEIERRQGVKFLDADDQLGPSRNWAFNFLPVGFVASGVNSHLRTASPVKLLEKSA
jgi:hypothetical protein